MNRHKIEMKLKIVIYIIQLDNRSKHYREQKLCQKYLVLFEVVFYVYWIFLFQAEAILYSNLQVLKYKKENCN